MRKNGKQLRRATVFSITRIMLYTVTMLLCACQNPLWFFKPLMPTSQCEQACEIQARQCQKICLDSCQRCTRGADTRAAKHYALYQHQQIVQGETIALELQSYRDPLQCRKTTCNCGADYSVCRQACGGKIHKRLQVVRAC